jgi:hypothetical protein
MSNTRYRDREIFSKIYLQKLRSRMPRERNTKKAAAPSIPCLMPSLVRSVALLSYLWEGGVSRSRDSAC